jgi:hypothetical protein
MKRFRSLLITLVLFSIFVIPALIPAKAQSEGDTSDTDYTSQSRGKEQDKAREGEVNKGGIDKVSHRNSEGSIVDDILPMKGISYVDEAYAPALYKQSAFYQVNQSVIALFKTPAANTYLAIQDFGHELGFLPQTTYAQGVGIGYAGMANLLPVWKIFRNVAYGLIAVFMIVIGFMIMFRKHIDPKTVVTVQNSLPKIIITLILITFSYAIVGVMIDLMYLLILLAVGTFDSAKLLPDLNAHPIPLVGDTFSTQQDLYTRGSIFSILGNIFPGEISVDFTNVLKLKSPVNINNAINPLVYKMLGVSDQLKGVWDVLGFLSIFFIRTAPKVTVPAAAIANIPHIIGLLIALALLFLMIRLFVFFLSSYIQVIISLIFAPIQLVMEVLPGSTAFADWIKNLVANLIVFPVGAIIFMLAAMFANLALNSTGGDQIWTAPYVPLISASATSIYALLSVAMLFTIPSIAGGIRESLKAKAFVDAGPGTIVGAFSAPISLAMQGFHMWQSHQTTKYLQQQAGLAQQQKGH